MRLEQQSNELDFLANNYKVCYRRASDKEVDDKEKINKL